MIITGDTGVTIGASLTACDTFQAIVRECGVTVLINIAYKSTGVFSCTIIIVQQLIVRITGDTGVTISASRTACDTIQAIIRECGVTVLIRIIAYKSTGVYSIWRVQQLIVRITEVTGGTILAFSTACDTILAIVRGGSGIFTPLICIAYTFTGAISDQIIIVRITGDTGGTSSARITAWDTRQAIVGGH